MGEVTQSNTKVGSAAALEVGMEAGGNFFLLSGKCLPDPPGGQISGTPPSVYREYLIGHMNQPQPKLGRDWSFLLDAYLERFQYTPVQSTVEIGSQMP